MPKLTLNRVFLLSLIGLLAGLGAIFWMVFHGLEKALLTSAEEARDRDSAVIGESVTDYLNQAPDAVTNFEKLLKIGFTRPSDPESLRDGLLSLLLRNEDISEATFTYANSNVTDSRGRFVIDPATVGQVSLFRAAQSTDFVHRYTSFQGGRYLSTHSHVTVDGSETEVEAPVEVTNPAASFTFTTPILPKFYGTLLWSDLQYFEIDQGVPEPRRRVEVSVQKTIEYPPGHFAGVLRIGLFKSAIDRAVEMPASFDTTIPHDIFLCDSDGRLIAISGSSHYTLSGDDLRVDPADASPQVMAALQQPGLHTVDGDNPVISGTYVTSGTTFLCTFRDLPGTQSWIVGMAVPRWAYLKDLVQIGRSVVWGSFILAAAIALFGGIVLHGVSVAHSIIVREAARMNDFVLEPSKNSSRLGDIDRVLASLERAKTAMRSMGKYVPLDLIRRLYHRGEEPRLGGEVTELSVLFTDIQGFTRFAESTDPGTVATQLGSYMHVVASVLQREKGTIDKFIGDSVMAFWNAPEPVPGHPVLACRAALACREALAELYRKPEWKGVPGFETRFGLNHCVASVGHFGSPERFNYTAIGDGINLASRLESLNKHYGTAIIASAELRAAAGTGFRFRHLDRVAVKGKRESIDIYELVCDSDAPEPAFIAAYEQALASWQEGNFARALALAEAQPGDPPSVFLAARCRRFIASPPEHWDGIYAFETK